MKKLCVLGSTGSIGVNTLKVIEEHPDRYQAIALSAGRNVDLLAEQIRRFRPRAVAMLTEELAARLAERLPSGAGAPEILHGEEGFAALAALDEIDTVVSAMTGAAGLVPTYQALRTGKEVALANKETLVMAGELVMAEASRQGVRLLPVDSEHSAIFQCLQGQARDDLRRIILTASGGPFRDFTLEQMAGVTPQQALAHPNWSMGPKVTVDSATMMNKGLEVIEAKWLFDLPVDRIAVLVHPQSIVHSLVEFCDGSVIAQMGIPDMRIPIAYALSYPRHLPNSLPQLALEEVGTLSFEVPDPKRFKALALAKAAADAGGSLPAVLNGANEVAVAAFLKGRIGYLGITDLVDGVLQAHHPFPIDSLEAVRAADGWARRKAQEMIPAFGND